VGVALSERLGLTRNYPGIEAVNYAERLQRDQIAPLEARMQEKGNPDFHVWPASAHDEYVVAVLAERFSGGPDLRVLGFRPAFRANAAGKRSSGPAIPGTITLSAAVISWAILRAANQPAC